MEHKDLIESDCNTQEYLDQYESTRAYIKMMSAVKYSKQILLNNRVQNFQAADVVALAKILVDLQEQDK